MKRKDGWLIQMRYPGLIIITAFLSFSFIAGAGDNSIVIDDFEGGLKKGWNARDFKGQTEYEVLQEEGNNVLKAVSNTSATGLVYRHEYGLKDYPIISWSWKVENIIEGGDATRKEGDDYAARVYVIFPHWFKPMTRSINYIWANTFPKNKYIPNSYHSRAIMIAVQSGGENVGKWMHERRNVYEDYKMVFGGEPPKAGGIAIMTDTDNTGYSAVAYYDNIKLERQ